MLFTSPDYPVFLAAVFFLYGLARSGSWPGVIGRWAIMLLLADLVFLLLAKDVGTLWDPLGGAVFHVLAEESAPPGAEVPWPPWWHFAVGLAVLAGFARLGYVAAARLAGDRFQKVLAIALVVILVVVGGTVLAGVRTGTLSDITAGFVAFGHLAFLAALGVVFGASATEEGRPFARIVILFLVSCIFYHAWCAAMKGAYQYLLALLLGTIVLDYYLALWIARTKDQRWRLAILIISLVSNFGILGVFKYYDFFTQDVLNLDVAPLHLVLPAGISFHTFQSMSYTIDVYRKELVPTKSVIQFATFVLFFPQLVAGPIVRAKELLPQLAALPRFDHARAADGLFRILVGLFKKIAIADFLAIALVDRVFENPQYYSSIEVMVALYAYALQIYLDFSAYSDIAIGSAQLIGFDLPENFRTPYRAANLQEFWRRWHISLSSWLRDYLYKPLGGSRGGTLLTYRNLILTMLLGGLWHGANWTFIVWGGLHGFGLAAVRFFQRKVEAGDTQLYGSVLTCAMVAALGLVVHVTAVSVDSWGDLVFAWLYLVPLWAVLTVALSSAPPVQVAGGGRRGPPRLVLHLRLAACATALALLGALHTGQSVVWLPYLGACAAFAWLADAIELGPDRAELRALALAAARRVGAVVLVFHYVCLAWVFFRAQTFDGALLFLERIAAGEWDAPNLVPTIQLAVIAGFVLHFFPGRTFAWLRARFVALEPVAQGAVMALAALVLRELAQPHIVKFIYFEF
jgi:D-alanyl-lipoteichoic acid acyltransferase DltB (MBOAT superfamily)